jgi:hypothetical protein
MKKKLLLLLGMCMVVTYASSAFAAVTLKRLGDHPFYRPAMTSEADLRTMVEKHSADLQVGFAEAGNPDLFPVFMSQFPTAKIDTIQIAPGERFDWMLFRKNGTGPVTAIKDVTWSGASAFNAFKFSIDSNGQRYVFIVPAACGNLSLSNVEEVPAVVNQDPVCSMTLSNSDFKCGQVITVDASGSSDPDGTIAEVIFRLVDASNQVVSEKIDKDAPFIQEFTIPCESSEYAVKVVVIDNNGAKSMPADCAQTIRVAAARRGGPVVDAGFARQFDPASYVFVRGGYEVSLTDSLTAMGLVGGFVRLEGDDGDDGVFIADALLNYYINDKLFVGGGAGFWSGNDGKVDLIVNMGYLIYENPGVMKTSLFVEGRCQADELVSSEATRLGVGVRFQF